MTERNDAQLRALFGAAALPLADDNFADGVMQQLQRLERAARLLACVQSGTLLALLALLCWFIEGRVLGWVEAANLATLLAQHPWWLASLIIAACLVPVRAARLFASGVS